MFRVQDKLCLVGCVVLINSIAVMYMCIKC